MNEADFTHRSYVALTIGAAMLVFAALQLWSGKAFIGLGSPWHPSPWATKKRERLLFWGNVLPLLIVGAFAVGLGLFGILRWR